MSRYIDADFMEKHYASMLINPTPDVTEQGKTKAQIIITALNMERGIDIVRCRECRYCKKKRGTFKGEPIIFYRCTENNRDVEADDFCSYGERKEP